MKLYGVIFSAYAARPILTARIKGIELPTTMPPGRGPAVLKSPEFLQLNPFGRIPVLECEHGVISESLPICEYLDEVGGGNKLMPSDSFQRARVRMLTLMVDHYVLTHWRALLPHINPAQRNKVVSDEAVSGMRTAIGGLETQVAGGPFVLGDSLTLADCLLFPSFVHLTGALREMFDVGDLLRDAPRLSRWFDRMNTHPVAGPTGKEQIEGWIAFARRVFFQ